MDANSNPKETIVTTEEQKPDLVDKKQLDHVLSDMHRYKEQARLLEEKLKGVETEKLKHSQQWEQLAKIKEDEANQARLDAEKIKNSFLNERKFSSIREEAIKLGIRTEALPDLDYVDLNDVLVETTSTGRVNVHNAKQVVEKLKLQKPHWFQNGQVPNVNANSPTVVPNSNQIAMKDIFEAEKKAKASGDYKEYTELLKRYQAQSKH